MDWPDTLNSDDMRIMTKEAIVSGYRVFHGCFRDIDKMIQEGDSVWFYDTNLFSPLAIYHWDGEDRYWKGSRPSWISREP